MLSKLPTVRTANWERRLAAIPPITEVTQTANLKNGEFAVPHRHLGGFFGEVACVEAVVFALLSDKLIVSATLNNSALLKHHDTV